MQSEFFSVRIPLVPPGINATYTGNGRGGKILTKDARAWLKGSGHIIGAKAGVLDFWIDQSYKYIIHVVWGGRGHDADAHIKIVQDALFEKLNADDRVVSTAIIQKIEADEEFVDVYLYRQDKVHVAIQGLTGWYTSPTT